ncbi:hypothetical protein AMATHDRAFT_80419 [Amanita thiersii Skay4041]|uniref:Peptidase M20 domain-containing protein 2 n=1 Tax=Amanita thiersii Skay4041 TaxID=703135 RepID=A0A2A9NM06_9AGAR|nr:hypothetical protein AMATHDRAFT_80419 [Amanita thiersii Skay4041]
MSTVLWPPDDIEKPVPSKPGSSELFRPDILQFIDKTINDLNQDLRTISVDIHSHPELKFKELYVHLIPLIMPMTLCQYSHAHDVLTQFMERQGFAVEKKFHLETAWRATFSNGTGGRTIGINSEMDALPGIGHACGHNLIAIAGVAVACALRAAMIEFQVSGKISLLGTPAEEGGSGKILLLKSGAYQDMDVCLMCHPGPGPKGGVGFTSTLALKRLFIEYHGRSAHAGIEPWEGINSLDAAVLAYDNISALRQQIRPAHRVHGIIEGRNWAPNDEVTETLPLLIANLDPCGVSYTVRAPSRNELIDTVKRVTSCFEAAGVASGCRTAFIPQDPDDPVYELRQNRTLKDGTPSASTDFGNVTYALPALHPGFAIPTYPNGGNHTADFAKTAILPAAHGACLSISIALAATGIRVLLDDKFFGNVQAAFENDKKERAMLGSWA